MPEENAVVGAETPVVAAETPMESNAPDTAEAQPADPKPADPEVETKKALKGVQKRINELTRERHEAEQRGRAEAEHWRQQAMAAAQRLQELEQAAPKPKLEQYSDLEQYTEAAAKYEAERLFREQMTLQQRAYGEAQQRHQEMVQQQQAQQRYQQVLSQKLDAATKKFPDFLDVVTSEELPGIQGTPAFSAILESDLGAEVMYYLGKNPSRAHQIVALSPIGQAREIGRIEAALQSGKIVSSAPPPPDTVGSGKGGAGRDPAKMSYDEFVAYRRKQIAQRR